MFLNDRRTVSGAFSARGTSSLQERDATVIAEKTTGLFTISGYSQYDFIAIPAFE